MDEKTELLNCPFCGCEPILERFEDYAFSIKCTHNYYWSEPDENGVRTAADIAIYADIKGKYNYETNDWEYTEEEINNCKKAAIEAWNTRAKDIDVPTKERTCTIEGYDTGYEWDIDDTYYQVDDPKFTLSCGHEAYGSVEPNFCPVCGARVIEDE